MFTAITVACLIACSDGFASASIDGPVPIALPDKTSAFAASPEGERIIAHRGSGEWVLIDGDDGTQVANLPQGYTTQCEFSPDGKNFIYVCDGDVVRVCTALTGEEVWQGRVPADFGSRVACAFSGESQTAVVSDLAGWFVVFDIRNGESKIFGGGLPTHIARTVIDRTGALMVVCGGGYRPLSLYHLKSHDRVMELEGVNVQLKQVAGGWIPVPEHPSSFVDAAYSFHRNRLVGISRNGSSYAEIWQWDLETGAIVRRDNVAEIGLDPHRVSIGGTEDEWIVCVGAMADQEVRRDVILVFDIDSGALLDTYKAQTSLNVLGMGHRGDECVISGVETLPRTSQTSRWIIRKGS